MLLPPDKKSADGPPAAISVQANDTTSQVIAAGADEHGHYRYAQQGSDLEAGYQQSQQRYHSQYSSSSEHASQADERQRLLSPSQGAQAPAPPSYDDYLSARAAQQQPKPLPMGAHGDPYGGDPSNGAKGRAHILRRFMLATCFALVLLIPLSAILGLVGELAKLMGGHHGSRGGSGGGDGAGNVGRHGGSGGKSYEDIPGSIDGWDGRWDPQWSYEEPLLPIEVDPRHCDLWSKPVRLSNPIQNDYLYGTRTTFELPFSALESHTAFVHFRDGATISGGELIFQSRAGGAKVENGNPELNSDRHFAASASEKSSSSPTIDVLVEAYYRDPRDFYGTHIWEAGADGNAGVVLMNSYASKIREQGKDVIGEHYRGPLYRVYVTLPDNVDSRAARKLLRVNNLELHTSNMRTTLVGDLAALYDFHGVSIKGHNGNVALETLTATTLLASTSNAPIHAERLEVTDVAQLRSSNGRISCETVCSTDDHGSTPRRLVIETSNGPIECERACAAESISLTTSSGSIAGSYDAPRIDGKASNGRISGSYSGIRGMDQKVGSGKDNGLSLRTSNGAMDVAISVGDGKTRPPIKHTPVTKTESVRLDLSSSNARVKATLRELPADIEIDLGVKTSNSDIELIGDSHFQGEFALQTSSHSKPQLFKLSSMDGEPERDLHLTAGRSGSSKSGWPWDGDIGGKGEIKGTLVRQGEQQDGKHVWSRIRAKTSNGGIHAEL